MDNKFKHIPIPKTYKLYIDGKFPRTESGRYYKIKTKDTVINISQSSKKDFRNAVSSARKAFAGWSAREPYNVAQITYRIAEMLEGRKHQFVEELVSLGFIGEKPAAEVSQTIDLLIYYAGWADKFQQVYSNINPVTNSFFNFSVAEPLGVLSVFAPDESPLLGFVASFLPAFIGKNTSVVLASDKYSPVAVSFAEVLNSSDVPGGTINILTGFKSELIEVFSTHKDINGFVYYGNKKEEIKAIQTNAAINVKRTIIRDFNKNKLENPYLIFETQDTKTTWHPTGI